jgi:hypothetical protein
MSFVCRAVVSVPEISAASTPRWGTRGYGRGARRAGQSGECLKKCGRCRAKPDCGRGEGRKRTGRAGVMTRRVRSVIGRFKTSGDRGKETGSRKSKSPSTVIGGLSGRGEEETLAEAACPHIPHAPRKRGKTRRTGASRQLPPPWSSSDRQLDRTLERDVVVHALCAPPERSIELCPS